MRTNARGLPADERPASTARQGPSVRRDKRARAAQQARTVVITPGRPADLANTKDEAAVLFVERGVILRRGEVFRAGQIVTLEGEKSVAIATVGEDDAVLVVPEAVGVR